MPQVQYLDVDAAGAGQRIDNFLLRHLKGVPQSHVYRILRSGEVRVNRGRVRPTYRLAEGDSVRLPPVRTGSGPGTRKQIPGTALGALQRAILYEDAELIVLNKPAGFAVHGGSGLGYGVIEALRQARAVTRSPADRPELVHRLDRHTSGCLAIAKTRPTLNALNEAFQHGQVDKHYLALVAGHWLGGARTVDVPLQRRDGRRGAHKMTVDGDGKAARSRFTPLEHLTGATLMGIRLDTGRMHQIRAHAAHLGHPVAGDRRYGSRDFNRAMRSLGLQRMFLHADRLAFTLPGSGHQTFEAPLGARLSALLASLRASINYCKEITDSIYG